MSSVLEFLHVARSYKAEAPVLGDVSFALGESEVVGLLGRNGSGKTTLIKIAMGMLYPQRGQVRAFGLDPAKDAVEVKRRVGYVAEDQILPGWSTVADILAFHRYLFPKWDQVMERELLDRFNLPAAATMMQLSKGQARQVALLCAVCHRPQLLLLDEPAGGLDPVSRREFLETSIQLLNREGTAILFSSHQMADVERIGGRVVLLHEGKVQLDMALDRLRQEVSLAIVPMASFPNAELIKATPGCLRVRSVRESWHAVVEGTPETVHRRLEASLGHNGVQCVRVPLEELFIELVGGDR